jgi:hypothetical protein
VDVDADQRAAVDRFLADVVERELADFLKARARIGRD